MTLEQLRIFLAVAERQHMTLAARDINITQSAASAAIAALEARYGIKLFDRVGRGIELTHAGRLFVVESRGVLSRAHAAERMLSDLAGLKRGALSLYASQTIASYWLPPVMSRFHDAYPAIELRMTIANTEQVAAATRDGTADIGFVEGPVDDPVLSSKAIKGDELVIVVGRNHPWASRKRLVAADLAKSKWVLREQGSGTRSMFEAALRRVGFRPETLGVALVLPSNEAVRAAIEMGSYAAALSALVVDAGIKAGTLHSPHFPLTTRRFLILRHKERRPGNAEKALLDLVTRADDGDGSYS